jgi:farnesyl diphosphate synthase
LNFIDNYQNRINQFLQKQLDLSCTDESRLKQAMAYSLLAGGKRIRPLLVYATADCINLDLNKADYIAASIEMIHAYSLIHDDLPAMDDDDLRRGKPTNHIAFDEATAILAGDALQSLAFETLSQTPCKTKNIVHAIKLLAQATGIQGMAGGQSLDLISENTKADLSQLQIIHSAKTGAILKACITLTTAFSDELTVIDQDALSQYAEHLGIAFQIVDDILDVTQDTETLGKPAHSDTKNNKSTYPSLLGLQQAKHNAEVHISSAFKLLETIGTQTEKLKQLTELIIRRTH